jgi:hypothetical protein
MLDTIELVRPAVIGHFNMAAVEVVDKIRSLGSSIAKQERCLRRQTIGFISKDEEKGSAYKAQILPYIAGLKHLAKKFTDDIRNAAASITSLSLLVPDPDNESLDSLWLSLTLAIEALGRRPSKEFSATLVGKNHNLVAWDVSHLCSGIEEKAEYYVKGIRGGRGYRIRCAEQNVLANYLKVQARPADQNNAKAVLKALYFFTQDLKTAARDDIALNTMTLYSGHFSCNWCWKILITGCKKPRLVVNRVITQWDDQKQGMLTGSYRKTEESRRRIEQTGLPVRIIKPYLTHKDF